MTLCPPASVVFYCNQVPPLPSCISTLTPVPHTHTAHCTVLYVHYTALPIHTDPLSPIYTALPILTAPPHTPHAHTTHPIQVPPVKLSVVFFYDLLDDGNADELSYHAGLPVEEVQFLP